MTKQNILLYYGGSLISVICCSPVWERDDIILFMPNLQNAKKALRQAQKRAGENKIVRDNYKQMVKHVRKGIEAGEKDLAEKIRLAQKSLGKATKKGVLKANTASRKLSRLMKKANATKK